MLKPVYVIEGRRCVPLARAAEMLKTNTTMLRRWAGEGRFDLYQLRAGSKTMRVAEDVILALRQERRTFEKEIASRAEGRTK